MIWVIFWWGISKLRKSYCLGHYCSLSDPYMIMIFLLFMIVHKKYSSAYQMQSTQLIIDWTPG